MKRLLSFLARRMGSQLQKLLACSAGGFSAKDLFKDFTFLGGRWQMGGLLLHMTQFLLRMLIRPKAPASSEAKLANDTLTLSPFSVDWCGPQTPAGS